MIEIVRPGDEDLRLDTARAIEGALDITLSVIGDVLPLEDVRTRFMDQGEVGNIGSSTLPDGTVDMRRFIVRQAEDRRTLQVPDNQRTMTIIPYPTRVIEGRINTTDSFGYSVGQVGEGTTSAFRILEQAARSGLRRKAALLIAFTAVHETGHLFGLVNPRAPQHSSRQHCGNACVMNTPHSVSATDDLIRRMGNNVCFCKACSFDLQRTNN